MPRAMLIVNPSAGRFRSFARSSAALTRTLSAHQFEIDITETTPLPHSAWEIAARASESCDLVIACGGDGTVHGVLQGIAHTRACLGVLPFGTANALARNLGLPVDPVAALHRLLSFRARQIPLGLAQVAGEPRWFTVMAGAGPDGRLVHEMSLSAKTPLGRGAYYTEAARLLLTRRFPAFFVEYRLVGSQVWQSREAVAMMASRIPDLGGPFSRLTIRSRLDHPHLLVQLLSAPAHLSLPAWFAYSRMGLSERNSRMVTLEVEEVRCSPLTSGENTHVQVDGEAFGVLPLSLRIVAAALNLLMP